MSLDVIGSDHDKNNGGPAVNRRYLLQRRPVGDFNPDVLQRVVEPIPSPGPNQALIRNLYLSLDPSNRIWMGEGESYMPPIALGDVMRGAGIGEVVASNTAKYPVGARVLGVVGWQDYVLIKPTDEFPWQRLPRMLPIPTPMMLGALGVTGMTAYFGMLHIGRPKRGEIMEAVFDLLNHHSRVVLCGLIAQYGTDGVAQSPRNFGNLLMRRVKLQGFNILDYLPRFVPAALRLALWILQGKVKDRHTIIQGLDQAPTALAGMFRGENIGKLIVQI